MRAVESWQRVHDPQTEMDQSGYEAMLDKIREALTPDEWRLASMRLRHGNELTLGKRMRTAIQDCGEHVSKLIEEHPGGIAKFVRFVVDERNSDGHALTRSPTEGNHTRMAWAMDNLRMVMLSTLAHRLLPAPDEAERSVTRRQKWEDLNSPYNELRHVP